MLRGKRTLWLAGVMLALVLGAGCAGAPTRSAGPPATLPGPDRAHLEEHGDRLAAQGQWMAALFQYSRALALAAEDDVPRLKAKMASAALADRQFVQAEALCQELIQMGYRLPAAWQGLGLARLGQGRLREARQALEKAVELEPRLWKAWSALGVIHDRSKRHRQAAQAFARAIAIEPKRAELYNNLGVAWLMAGELTRASQALEKALALRPGYRLAAANLGLVRARQGRWDEARRLFTLALGPAAAHNNLGCLLAWRGDYARAREEFERALEASPRYYPLARRHLDQVRSLAPPPRTVIRPLPVQSLPQQESQASTPPARNTTSGARPSAQLGQGAGIGLVGVVAKEDEPHLVEGLLVGLDGLLHRRQGHARGLVQGVAVGAGGDAGEGHGTQAVARSQGERVLVAGGQ